MRRPTSHRARRRATLVLLASWFLSPAAEASDSATAEIGAGQSRPIPQVQPSAFEYEKLAGRYEPTEELYFSGQVRLQHDFPAATAPGTSLYSGPDWVWFFAGDASYDATKHLSFSAGVTGSPSSSRDIATPLGLPTGRGRPLSSNALMSTTGASLGGSLEVTYDTSDDDAPERALDGSIELSVAYTRYQSDQTMIALDAPGRPDVLVSDFESSCGSARSAPCEAVAHAAEPASAALGQTRLGAAFTVIIQEKTDVTLDASYDLYDKKRPEDVGFFTFTPPAGGGQTASYGAGLAILPPRFSLRPEVGHRWGSVSVRGWYEFSDFTAPSTVGHAVGAKMQVSVGSWRVYATASYLADLSTQGTAATTEIAETWAGGLGLTRVF